jgi:DNA repair protein SbcC/Rad50
VLAVRPVRLELEGFTAFRERTVVDFADVDLFALTGPTGAGKSSVIDAMIFALYGTVPRFGDDRLVGAVVSQGRTECRVRLDFDVGAERWTAVRVVRQRDGRATTREARLERAGAVVAGNATELDIEVAALLGLDAHQFMTCVVLPQGQFARFLQARPAERQTLLVRLLELGLYDAVREAAGQRAGRLEGERAGIVAHLEALVAATPEAAAAERERLCRLTAAQAEVEARLPELEALARRAEDLDRTRLALVERVTLLGRVRVPEGVGELAEQAEAERERLAAAEQGEGVAAEAAGAAREHRRVLGDRAPLEAWQRALGERPRLGEQLQLRRDEAAVAVARQAELDHAARRAQEAARHAVEAYEAAVAGNRAAALRAALSPGDVCPVCDQPVTSVPHHEDPAEIGAARQVRDRAAAGEAAATDAAQKAAVATARAHERVTQAEQAVAAVAAALDGAPAADVVAERLAAIDRAEDEVTAATAAREAAAATRQRAAQRLEQVVAQERTAWATFDAERDAVAGLGPPAADRASVATAWAALVAWAAERRAVTAAEAGEVDQAATAVAGERQRLWAALDRTVHGAGLSPEPGRPHRDVVVEARARSEQAVGVLEADIAKRVLDQVLRDLCASASELLHRLSQSSYSLSLDDRGGFVVVDHANADETRMARTLSGGETFLASLALALALAEQVARTGQGAAHLESLFLDEGFGTLDADTLDVVAAAMEDLGAGGRMVGLVSHVPELAERVPVRFDVRRGIRGSTVERVER